MLIYTIGFFSALLIALLLTPVVRWFAHFTGAVDQPNHRKVHTKIMPRLGGLAIFAAFAISFFIVSPAMNGYNMKAVLGLLIGGSIILFVGALDDRFELSAKWKLLGQLVAAGVVASFGLTVDIVNLPFGSTLPIGWLSIPLTIFWIVGVTNAINLIDGLDGLAGGVSAIATGTIFVLAMMMGNVTVMMLSAALLGAIIGFLFYNFYPAKIFMGDSGALFLGFSLATLSILGFKQATFVSFVVPLVVLGVPLSDTFFAIVRRTLNKKPISVADKNHLHHSLLESGLSHRNTVLVIYGIAIFFGLCAVLMTQTSQWLTILIIAVLMLVLQVGAEAVGIFAKGKRPILQLFSRMRVKATDVEREGTK